MSQFDSLEIRLIRNILVGSAISASYLVRLRTFSRHFCILLSFWLFVAVYVARHQVNQRLITFKSLTHRRSPVHGKCPVSYFKLGKGQRYEMVSVSSSFRLVYVLQLSAATTEILLGNLTILSVSFTIPFKGTTIKPQYSKRKITWERETEKERREKLRFW